MRMPLACQNESSAKHCSGCGAQKIVLMTSYAMAKAEQISPARSTSACEPSRKATPSRDLNPCFPPGLERFQIGAMPEGRTPFATLYRRVKTLVQWFLVATHCNPPSKQQAMNQPGGRHPSCDLLSRTAQGSEAG